MRNKAVTGIRAIFNKDPRIGDARRTGQLLAHHPQNIADETAKRSGKSEED
jgi:hypothetical protein